MFEQTLYAGWGDIDFNSHMRNTAYLDKSGDVRMQFFASVGFSMAEFMAQRFGPVVRKDEVEYFKEIALLDEFRVTLSVVALSEDGGRFKLRNEFYHGDGRLAAKVTSSGGWLDLKARKLRLPPSEIDAALRDIVKADEFEVLPSLK